MRLAGISIVRDEADIIEPWARHNCHFLDKLYIVDNGSTDSTRQIIQDLIAEGLPIEMVDHGQHGAFYQGQRTTRLMRHAAADGDWDFIVPLDGDECICATDRGTLEAELADFPAAFLPSFREIRYKLSDLDDPAIVNPLERIRHVQDKAPAPFKCIVPRALALNPDAALSDGNHRVRVAGVEVPRQLLENAALAHFALRSQSQIIAKLMVTYITFKAREDYVPTLAPRPIEAAGVLCGEEEIALHRFDDLVRAYDGPEQAGLYRPFTECRGETRFPHLANTFPYRRTLRAVDDVIAEMKARSEEVRTLKKDLFKARMGPVRYFFIRKSRSFAKHWQKLRGG
jgi:hypothetical protein